jgi:N-carbamoylputrescine amidase
MADVGVAATQMACSWERDENIDRAENLVRQAAAGGASIVLIQELFETPYFPIEQSHKHRSLARPLEESQVVDHFSKLAKELEVVVPISFFEKAGEVYFNSVAMADADGTILGVYRKSHIPNAQGYQEKEYFSPGDTGFRVFNTRYGNVGVLICWDQWFPEAARCLTLMGADIILYPTAIGSGLGGGGDMLTGNDSVDAWRNAMCGHAACNILPVVASNRIGREYMTESPKVHLDFYGNSFIADHEGQVVAQAGRDQEEVLVHRFDFNQVKEYRDSWAVFRDRRPDLYGALATLDGG